MPWPVSAGSLTENIHAAASNVATHQLATLWKAELPIKYSEHTLYPTSQNLPGPNFAPIPLDLLNQPETKAIAPGDYQIPAHFYCTNVYSANGSGHSYKLAKLEGKLSNVLAKLYLRASKARTPETDLQILSWSIQTGVAYDDLPTNLRIIVDKLIPEHRSQLQLGLAQKINREWDAWSARTQAPSLKSTLARMGNTGKIISQLLQAREQIISGNNNYHSMVSAFVRPNFPSQPNKIRETSWSRVHDRIYMRFIAPLGALNDGYVQIRILAGSNEQLIKKYNRNFSENMPNFYLGQNNHANFEKINIAYSDLSNFYQTSQNDIAQAIPIHSIPQIAVAVNPNIILAVITASIAIAVVSDLQSLTATVKSTNENATPVPHVTPFPTSVTKDPEDPDHKKKKEDCEKTQKELEDLKRNLAKREKQFGKDQWDLKHRANSKNPGGDLAGKGTRIGHLNQIIGLNNKINTLIAKLKALECP